MGELLDVSVIICAYTEDRWNDLCAAVDSVRQQTVKPLEITVVVDHSPRLLARARAVMPDVQVVENREGQGASGSRNSGVAVAKGAVFAFLDDDAEAKPDWLEQLLLGYGNPNIMGVGGTLAPVWLGGRPSWFPDEFKWVVGCTYTGLPEELSPVRNLISANMSVRRTVFEAISGFRTGFGKVGKISSPEDTDLCIRAFQIFPHGVWLYKPQASVQHKVPASRSTRRYFLWRCFNEGQGKAHLSRLVGSKDGLASERAYILKVLPRGCWTGLEDALTRHDMRGLGRSSAILTGLAVTALGYLAGLIFARPGVKNSHRKSIWSLS